MSELEKVKARVRKLREMTKNRGCSEAEAMAAAEKAARLMAVHGLRDGDLEFTEDEIAVRHAGQAVRARLWSIIGVCTNCSPIIVRSDFDIKVSYVGREPGPEIATYLHVVTDRAINREIALFRKTTWYKRRRTLKAKRQATADFTVAMCRRLTQRLGDLFDATISAEALEEAKAERDARFGEAETVKAKLVPNRYFEAYTRGRTAGDGVALSHGLNGQKGPEALEAPRHD